MKTHRPQHMQWLRLARMVSVNSHHEWKQNHMGSKYARESNYYFLTIAETWQPPLDSQLTVKVTNRERTGRRHSVHGWGTDAVQVNDLRQNGDLTFKTKSVACAALEQSPDYLSGRNAFPQYRCTARELVNTPCHLFPPRLFRGLFDVFVFRMHVCTLEPPSGQEEYCHEHGANEPCSVLFTKLNIALHNHLQTVS